MMRRCSVPDGRTLPAFWFALDPTPGPWQGPRRQWGGRRSASNRAVRTLETDLDAHRERGAPRSSLRGEPPNAAIPIRPRWSGGDGGAPVGDRGRSRGGHRAGAQPGPAATGPDRTPPALAADLAEPAGLGPPPAKGAAESPAPGPPRRHPTPRDPSAHHQAGHDPRPDRGGGAGRRRDAAPARVTGGEGAAKGGSPVPPWPRSGGSRAARPAG